MYFKYNKAEEVKAHLTELLNDARARLQAWQAVKVNKKKSGEEFAPIARALEGAKTGIYSPVEDFAHPYITINYKTGNRYGAESIEAYFYCDKLADKGASRETVYNGGIIRSTSPQTAEEVRESIKKHIERLEETAASLEKQIAICEAAFNAYREAIEQAEKTLKETCNTAKRAAEIGETSLYYAITATR